MTIRDLQHATKRTMNAACREYRRERVELTRREQRTETRDEIREALKEVSK